MCMMENKCLPQFGSSDYSLIFSYLIPPFIVPSRHHRRVDLLGEWLTSFTVCNFV